MNFLNEVPELVERHSGVGSGLTPELSHPGTRRVVRDSGTEGANPGWLQRFVRCCHVTVIPSDSPTR